MRSWTARKHGEVGYHVSQVLTGHGCFRAYLHAIGKANTEQCWYCDATPEHAVFGCSRWRFDLYNVEVKIGGELKPENVVEVMLGSVER